MSTCLRSCFLPAFSCIFVLILWCTGTGVRGQGQLQLQPLEPTPIPPATHCEAVEPLQLPASDRGGLELFRLEDPGSQGAWMAFVVPAQAWQLDLRIQGSSLRYYAGTGCEDLRYRHTLKNDQPFPHRLTDLHPGQIIWFQTGGAVTLQFGWEASPQRPEGNRRQKNRALRTQARPDDHCVGAIRLPSWDNNIGATGLDWNPPGDCNQGNNQGHWFSTETSLFYTFEVTPASTPNPIVLIADVNGCRGGANNLQMGIWSSCATQGGNGPGFYGCASGVGQVKLTSLQPLPPGQYLLVVDGDAGSECTYSFLSDSTLGSTIGLVCGPGAPDLSAEPRCGSGQVTISVNIDPIQPGYVAELYQHATGGNPLDVDGTSPLELVTPHLPLVDTMFGNRFPFYVATSDTIEQCGSPQRRRIDVLLQPLPGDPEPDAVVVQPGKPCSYYARMGEPNGNVIRLYSSPIDTTVLDSSMAPYYLKTPPVTQNTTFWLESFDTRTRCISRNRIPVTCNIIRGSGPGCQPAPPTVQDVMFCPQAGQSGTVTFTAKLDNSPSGNQVTVVDMPLGGNIKARQNGPYFGTYEIPFNITGETTYYFEAVDLNTGCRSPLTRVVARKALPPAPATAPPCFGWGQGRLRLLRDSAILPAWNYC